MPLTTCPPPADLERLFLGGLPEKEVETLERHLLECGPCLHQLKKLFDTKETLVGVLREEAPSDSVSSAPVVEDLMNKLERLPSVFASKSDDTETRDSPNPGRDSSLTDFLAPGQSDDELGRLGKYRILQVLGHGGMGVVYKAEDTQLKRIVALKAMLPTLAASASAGKRFLREAEAMAAVEHDRIVRIYQIDQDRGVPFLAMEFLKGESLDERLKREGRLPVKEALRIGREVAEGLAAAHATGLIHRDIKPGNIWLEASPVASAPGVLGALTRPRSPGRVKILDFGLARAVSQDAGLTLHGAIIGTPAYMAPEQGRGDAVDARCDLFSLGVVMYRLCCGQYPFRGKDTVSTLLAVATQEPAPPRTRNVEVPMELSDLIVQLLQKDPERRPVSAGEVVQTLHAVEKKLARERESRDAAPSLPVTPPRKRRRIPLLIAAAVLLTGMIGVGLWGAGLIRIGNDQGDFVIDTRDEDFSFSRGKDGGFTLEDRKTKRTYGVKVVRQDKDEYELEVTDADADLSFKTKTFTIKRGDKVALRGWFERKAAVVEKLAPIPDAWFKAVAAMSAEEQVEAVASKLKERNPGFDGEVSHTLEDGVVTELQFVTNHVTDLSPVRALTGLQSLDCSADDSGRSQLSDLSPLGGMKLRTLICYNTAVADLSPLRGMPLTALHCAATSVTDLAPLADMRLTVLTCDHTRVADLSPLKGMALETLFCHNTLVSDLTPLERMPLSDLRCSGTRVADLIPLKDMKLTVLAFDNTPVSDLSPLEGMPIEILLCDKTRVTDLSLLKGMRLRELRLDFKPERDTDILRSIKTLERINQKPAADFWKDVDALPKP